VAELYAIKIFDILYSHLRLIILKIYIHNCIRRIDFLLILSFNIIYCLANFAFDFFYTNTHTHTHTHKCLLNNLILMS